MFKIDTFYVGHIPGSLDFGFWSEGTGEERMLQNIAHALIKAGCKVHVSDACSWKAQEEKPANLFFGLPKEDFIYIDYGPGNPFVYLAAKLTLLCVFDFSNHYFNGRDKAVFFSPYVSHTYEGYTSWVRMFVNRFVFLPYIPPNEPVLDKTNFDKHNIFWTNKEGFVSHSQTREGPYRLMSWIASKLEENKEAHYYMVSYARGFDADKITKGITSSPLYGLVSKYGDRIHLLGRLSYKEVVDVLRKTKVIVNKGIFGHTFCGSPIPAALCGIPSVQYEHGPYVCMSGVLKTTSGNCDEHVSLLNRLYVDGDFYNTSAEKYFNYSTEFYSYDRFVFELSDIINTFV